MFGLLLYRFFQLLQLCQMQEFETIAHCLQVLPMPAAELYLGVFFLPCSRCGNQRASFVGRLTVAFMWLLHDTAAHLAT